MILHTPFDRMDSERAIRPLDVRCSANHPAAQHQATLGGHKSVAVQLGWSLWPQRLLASTGTFSTKLGQWMAKRWLSNLLSICKCKNTGTHSNIQIFKIHIDHLRFFFCGPQRLAVRPNGPTLPRPHLPSHSNAKSWALWMASFSHTAMPLRMTKPCTRIGRKMTWYRLDTDYCKVKNKLHIVVPSLNSPHSRSFKLLMCQELQMSSTTHRWPAALLTTTLRPSTGPSMFPSYHRLIEFRLKKKMPLQSRTSLSPMQSLQSSLQYWQDRTLKEVKMVKQCEPRASFP